MTTPIIHYAVTTVAGQALIADAAFAGEPLGFTHMTIGDGNGAPIVPSEAMTSLVHQVDEVPLTAVQKHPLRPNVYLALATLPKAKGGYVIRELGVRNAAGVHGAIASFPAIEKPVVLDESAVTGELKLTVGFVVTQTGAVKVFIDPSMVYATQEFINAVMAGHVAENNPHSQYQLKSELGIVDFDHTAIKDLKPGGIYRANTGTAACTARLPAIDLADKRPITLIRRGTANLDILRMNGTDTIEGSADDLRADKNYQVLILSPSSATNWRLDNRRK